MKGALTIDKIALLVLAILVILGVSYLVFSGTSVFRGGITSFKCEANEIAYCSIGSKWDPACGPEPECPGTTTTSPTTTSTTTPTTTSTIIPTEPHGLKKYIVIYGGYHSLDEDIDYLASNFDFVDTQVNYADDVAKIKNVNPDIVAVFYKDLIGVHKRHTDVWEDIDPHEDWFLHDIDGNRIINKRWGWYLMDPGSDGWRNYYADQVKDVLDRYPQFDGVFADDCWGEFYDSWNYFTVDDSKLPPYIAENWNEWIIGMLKVVKNKIGDKLLTINCNRNPLVYIDYVDGRMDEGFVHYPWQGADKYIGVKEWKDEVNTIYQWSSRNKYVMAQGGVEAGASDEEKKSLMNFCLCSFLLGFNGPKALFGFKPDGYGWAYRYEWLHPEYEYVSELGVPTGDYYLEDSIYVRDFKNGKVLVNPSTDAHTITLDKKYKTLDGKEVSSITLNPHSGEILKSIFPTKVYVVGKQLYDSGTPIYLRGFNLWTSNVFETYAMPIEQSHLRHIKEWGFNTIDMQMFWGKHVEPNYYNVGEYDEGNLQRLEQIIEWANEEGLYVTLSMRVNHATCVDGTPSYPSWAGWAKEYMFVDSKYDDAPKMRQRFYDLWAMMIERFDHYDNVIGYNWWFFPWHICPWTYRIPEEANVYYDTMTPELLAVTRARSNKIIFFTAYKQGSHSRIGSEPWYEISSSSEFYYMDESPNIPLNDDNVVYCHGFHRPQYVEWVEQVKYDPVTGERIPWDYDTEYLWNMVKYAVEFSNTNDVPIMVTEFGLHTYEYPDVVLYGDIAQDRLDCYDVKLDLLDEHQYNWVYWTFAGPGSGVLKEKWVCEELCPTFAIVDLLRDYAKPMPG